MKKSLSESSYIVHKKALISPSTCVICALSGGQDSVLLFFILIHLKKIWNLKIVVVYCQHFWQLQNLYTIEEVWKLTSMFQIPVCFFFAEYKLQNEATAGVWRQNKFCRSAEFFSSDTIVIGHTASDNIETAIWHIARGASPKAFVSLANPVIFNKGSSFPSPGAYSALQTQREVNKLQIIKFPRSSAFNNPNFNEESQLYTKCLPKHDVHTPQTQRKQIMWPKSINKTTGNFFTYKCLNKFLVPPQAPTVLKKVTRSHISISLRSMENKTVGSYSPSSNLMTRNENGATSNLIDRRRSDKNKKIFCHPSSLRDASRNPAQWIVPNNPIKSCFIIRPLTDFHRCDVNLIVSRNNLPHITDKTNQNMIFTRNRIRSEVLPLLRYFINERSDLHLYNYLQMSRTQQDFFETILKILVESYCNIPKSIRSLLQLPESLQSECIYQLMKSYTSRQVSRLQIKNLRLWIK